MEAHHLHIILHDICVSFFVDVNCTQIPGCRYKNLPAICCCCLFRRHRHRHCHHVLKCWHVQSVVILKVRRVKLQYYEIPPC